MATPQIILTRKHQHAFFLVLTLSSDADLSEVSDAISGFTGRVRSVASRAPAANLVGIIGFGSQAWDRLFSGPRPTELHPFIALQGKHTAPSTPGDILLHLKADTTDLCYELATIVLGDFGANVTVVDEVHGFRYFDMRDLIGFVDGTENPAGAQAVETITCYDEAPTLADGSYVTVQRYVTDMVKWNALTVDAQEDAIGRSKSENIEMSDDAKPTNAHIALNVVYDDEGNQLQIFRDNMPWGSAEGERGTYFIAYSSSPAITERMLENMFIGDPVGNTDRLLDFTTAVTGSQFYVPPVEFVDDPPPVPDVVERTDGDDDEAAPAQPITSSDGSLGIGSLH